ncbi:MAG: GNAT family N-acetyltransferase [Candidatus Cloacimonetes bacterium]|nr:GNAT family N-acetyltransferase [Candidatus Cloacimonadota bacterium]
MKITINEVKNKKDLRKFVAFPYKLYKGNKYWIPQLKKDEMSLFIKEKNPAFDFCDVKLWLAYKNEQVVGRIAGIINHNFIEKWKNKYARFGWIDFVDDENVPKALLNTVENWAKENGMDAVHGPLGFTDLDPEGMLIEGFEELGTIATIYNYPYYAEHLEKYGYSKDIDWIEYEIKIPDKVPEKVERIAGITLKKNKLEILKVSKIKEMKPYMVELFEVMNSAYKDLYGFVPLSEKQIRSYIEQYISFANPKFISIILDGDGKVAAFGITFPSLSKSFQKARGKLFPFGFIHILKALKKNNLVDLYLVAVRPDLQGKGVNSLLFSELIKIYINHNFEKAESNPELETNSKVQAQWKFFDRRQHKRRRCFIKHL